MDIYEVTGYTDGINDAGVNFLSPLDSFQALENGYVYRQVLQSRFGFTQFANRLADGSRVMGIFNNINPQTGILTTLVCSKNYLYKYNGGTDTFDQIPFGGSAAPFNISLNEAYVSGTTYPDKDNSERFIFCSYGMSQIYYYDGVNVKVFTIDDPDYAPPVGGALTIATYVAWFGERLNFFKPVIGGIEYPQSVLYSAIRDASGNGDKFNVPGSGVINFDTYELMKGINVIADFMIINFQRSNWVLQKTRDPFNPYFPRKILSVVGTDASFSAVSWAYEVKSVGKTGLVTTDGRQSLRFDNKLPNFTQDEIDEVEIELTYGGFDRGSEQFLFAYRSSDSNLVDITQDKELVYNYKEETFSINTRRFSVYGQSDNGTFIPMGMIDETFNPSWARMDTTEEIWNKIGIGNATEKTLAGDNNGFVYQINSGNYDYFATITGITQAPQAVITCQGTNFAIGDRIIIQNVLGMTEINGTVYTVQDQSDTTITINEDSSNFTAYASGGSLAKTISFQAGMIPFNPYRAKGRKVYISHIEVLMDTNAGDCTVDMYVDEYDEVIKSVLMTSPQIGSPSRVWNTAIADIESNFITFVLRNESAGNRTIITSIRIHASEGSFTAS